MRRERFSSHFRLPHKSFPHKELPQTSKLFLSAVPGKTGFGNFMQAYEEASGPVSINPQSGRSRAGQAGRLGKTGKMRNISTGSRPFIRANSYST